MLVKGNFYTLYHWLRREYFADESLICGRVVLRALSEYIHNALLDLYNHSRLVVDHEGRERIEVNDILLILLLGSHEKYHIVKQVTSGERWKYLGTSIYLLSEPVTIHMVNVSHIYVAKSCRKLLANIATSMLYVIMYKCFYMARRLHINRMDVDLVHMMIHRAPKKKNKTGPYGI